ncbi:hypothetical protein, partial [Mesorhizobium sp. M4B.F.Ca.ET.143.01.1.1]|uniref:hypothetical protein n=1 Tax=Mesorhizobium sp. M4B.F.Ca.ET.143.01.1.1 TaxID=2563947 RepID=UPI001AEF1B23
SKYLRAIGSSLEILPFRQRNGVLLPANFGKPLTKQAPSIPHPRSLAKSFRDHTMSRRQTLAIMHMR